MRDPLLRDGHATSGTECAVPFVQCTDPHRHRAQSALTWENDSMRLSLLRLQEDPPMKAPGLPGCCVLAALLMSLSWAATGEATPEELIRQAGNAEYDAERLKILKQLQTTPGLDETLRKETEKLTAVVDRWVNDPRLFQWFDKDMRKRAEGYGAGVVGCADLQGTLFLHRIWRPLVRPATY